MAFLMIFYIFMKLIFLPKSEKTNESFHLSMVVVLALLAATTRTDDKQTSFKMQAKEDFREFISISF